MSRGGCLGGGGPSTARRAVWPPAWPKPGRCLMRASSELPGHHRHGKKERKRKKKRRNRTKHPCRHKLRTAMRRCKSLSLWTRDGVGRQSKDRHLPKRAGTASRPPGQLAGVKRAGQARFPWVARDPRTRVAQQLQNLEDNGMGGSCAVRVDSR